MSKVPPTKTLRRGSPPPKGQKALRRGVGYIRVSRTGGREKDGDSFISPKVQRETIARLAKAKGIRIVAWYEDLNVSGGKADRPQFELAVGAIESGEADAILVARMSRFARSVLNARKALERIEDAGGQLLADDLNLDASTPEGRMMRTIFFAIAEWELEVAREQAREAQGNAHARGVKIGKVPPGYCRNFDEEEGVLADPDLDPKALVVDPVLGPVVADVFVRRANGAAWSALVAFWHEQTGEHINRQRLADVIRNRTYLGELRNGGGRVKVGAVEALVSEEIWNAAQSSHVVAPRPSRSAADEDGALLAGILVCSSCDHPMTSASAGAGKGTLYRCNRPERLGPCPRPMRAMAKVADPVVEKQFLAWARKQNKVEGTSRRESDLDAALVAEEQADAELEAMIASQSSSRFPDKFTKRLAELEDALVAAQDRVAELRASGHTASRRTDAVRLYTDPEATLEDKRQLLAGAIARVEVHAPEGRSARGVPFSERSLVVFRD